MGARYLKTEDEIIARDYPTASKENILELIPNRTWAEIGVHARKKGIHRSSEAWGNSVREGRKLHKDAWTDQQNELFDVLYPEQTRAQLIDAFHNRTWLAIQSHAQKRNIHRTREAVGRQMNIGRKNARKEKG
jgi:hypothetical protein